MSIHDITARPKRRSPTPPQVGRLPRRDIEVMGIHASGPNAEVTDRHRRLGMALHPDVGNSWLCFGQRVADPRSVYRFVGAARQPSSTCPLPEQRGPISRGGNPSMTALITRIVDMPQPIKVEIASQRDGAHEYAYSKPQR